MVNCQLKRIRSWAPFLLASLSPSVALVGIVPVPQQLKHLATCTFDRASDTGTSKFHVTENHQRRLDKNPTSL